MVQYCTTLEVFDYLGWTNEVPEFVSGEAPTPEEVDTSGTLANGSVIYLDRNRIINNTLVLSHGADATSLTQLTETTDYTIDLDKGKITITAAGATAIGTDNVYAEEYSYIAVDDNTSYKDTFVSDLIDRATKHIDLFCRRTFQSFTFKTRQEYVGRGKYATQYRVRDLPLNLVVMVLGSNITDSDTSITVDSTSNLTAGDYVSIENEVLLVDSVDNSTTFTATRAQFGTTAAAHTAAVEMVNIVVETSNTPTGSTPTFNLQQYKVDYDVHRTTGIINIFNQDVTEEGVVVASYPPKNIPNRVMISYNVGESSVPVDITHACVTQVAKWLMSSAFASATARGRDDFTPQVASELDDNVKQILQQYRLLLADGS